MGRRVSADQAARWQAIVARQSRSGLSVAAFCRAESLSAPIFYAWRRRLGGSPPARPGARQAPAAPEQLLPVAVEARPTAAPLRIFLPHGVCLEVGADAASLAEALRLLCEPGRC